ncbi:hypothetical protein L6E12_02300, partial [Actinokineospora sp. PR83]|uniref:hypothetical protein n=1 Tax=Actinokineospora sp. PR83 TaxID=2884908 RepID=UPI001F3F38D9
EEADPRRGRGEPSRRQAESSVTSPPRPTGKPPRATPDRGERAAGRSRTVAAERAYARRAQREGHPPTPGKVPAHNSNHRRNTTVAAEEEATSGRASFVVLVIALLVVGVATTLWLTTQAIADSYRLEAAKQEATVLAERAAELQREVARQESAPALAERARQLGMVPAGDPGHIVVDANGGVTVVGDPEAATAPTQVRSPEEIAAQQQAQQQAEQQAQQQQAQQGQPAPTGSGEQTPPPAGG